MTTKLVPQNPIILRCHRVMEAFAKSDDERDFYLDRFEGFLICVDLDKTQEEIDALMRELNEYEDRYVQLPKLTFYEVKKLMEAFANEKVYDIDTKEKLLDIIQSKEARENFLEFIYDQHAELEKWQQYYQERFRIRIIEWLRNNKFDFVFEEDVELTKSIVEKVKMAMFTPKVGKDVAQARKIFTEKAATYYSNEALNPRPKRGRPPKQIVKVETEPQFSADIYVSIPKSLKPFLFAPDYHSSSMIFTFSGKFDSEAELLAHRRQQLQSNLDLENLSQKLSALKSLSASWQREQGSFAQAIAGGPVEELPEIEKEEVVVPQVSKRKKAVSKAKSEEVPKQTVEPKAKVVAVKKAESEAKVPVKKKAEPTIKAPPKKKVAPKAKAVAKKKPEPKAKVVAKKKVAPKAKAAAKKKVAPKTKAAAKKKAEPKAKVVAKKAKPKAKVVAKKKVAPKTKVVAKKAKPKAKVVAKKKVASKAKVVAKKAKPKAKPAVKKKLKPVAKAVKKTAKKTTKSRK